MSLFLTFVLIAIAWLLSTFLDALPHLWHLISSLPWWLIGLTILGTAAWILGEP